jgi:hypothetical protein
MVRRGSIVLLIGLMACAKPEPGVPELRPVVIRGESTVDSPLSFQVSLEVVPPQNPSASEISHLRRVAMVEIRAREDEDLGDAHVSPVVRRLHLHPRRSGPRAREVEG